MSLISLLKSPSSLFKKDIITFLIIQRYDLGVPQKTLRYISVRPNTTLTGLRNKVWHLLELPDYCEEKIVLKNDHNVEVPLTELRKGNTPQTPFLLEVWPPEKRIHSSQPHNMLTMGKPAEPCAGRLQLPPSATVSNCSNVPCGHNAMDKTDSSFCNSHTTVPLDFNRTMKTVTEFDFKKCDLPGPTRKSSLFHLRLQGKRSVDNFSNVLLKIQTDLVSITQKLATLEHRVAT